MAGASPFEVARLIYNWAKNDSSRIATVRSWRDDGMTAAFGSKGGANAIQNASKNGVAYSVLVQLDEVSRLSAIDRALSWLEAGSMPVTRTRAVF